MGRAELVQRPPTVRLILFAAAAFGISWTLWFLHPVFAHDPGIALTLDQLATFGPAAAALLVANDRSTPTANRPRAVAPIAGMATLTVTALLLTPRWVDASSLLEEVLLVVLAAVPAALVWAAASQSPRLVNLLGSILSPRSSWWTYAVALLLFPAASVLGSGLVMLFGGDLGAPPQALAETSWTSILIVFGLTLLFGGPFGEEIGWRGWLLPTLQVRLSPLLASLIIGLVWGLWHLPLHLRGMYDGDMGTGAAGFMVRIASSCLLAVLFTWLYNRARGGLLVVILLHTSVNNTSGYWLPVNAGLTVVLLVVAVVVVLTDRMYARPPAISHRRSTWMQPS
jgi:membrane protease YdiL (CAAX protease family)